MFRFKIKNLLGFKIVQNMLIYAFMPIGAIKNNCVSDLNICINLIKKYYH